MGGINVHWPQGQAQEGTMRVENRTELQGDGECDRGGRENLVVGPLPEHKAEA